MDLVYREAMHYKKLPDGKLACELCPHYCVLGENESGICRSRKNMNGKLWAINYGRSIGLAVDPIEKKPLYHFHPGSMIVSLGPNSCNLKCDFCQNFQSSQFEVATREIEPSVLYEHIYKLSKSPKQVAFTYTEPFTWYEFIYDFAEAYPDVQIGLISNGFINDAPLREILPKISAMNIDLKAFSDDFYVDFCAGRIDSVKNTIKSAFEAGVHLEITLLLIPGRNDDDEEIRSLSQFIASISKEIPLHISAYRPAYLSSIPATNVEDVIRAVGIAKESLNWVYGGNLPGMMMANSVCVECGSLLIERRLGYTQNFLAQSGVCKNCGFEVYGVFD